MGFNRISRFYVNMYLGPGFRIDGPEGLCVAKMTEEDDTTTTRDDHILTMFAVNSGTGQIVYNVRLVQPRVYGSEGSGPSQFRRPHGICCNAAGDVYVADTDNGRLVRLRYSTGSLNWVGVIDSTLSSPRDVAVDSRGRVYVTNTDRDEIRVYDADGGPVGRWTPGLSHPEAVAAIDRGAPYNKYGSEYAVVVDRWGTRLNQLTLDGRLLRQIDCRRLGLDTSGFSYCAFDLHGNCYVTDRVNEELHVFDPALHYVVSYGRSATGPNLLKSPRGIAIWRRYGQVFVSESDGGQYLWVGLDGYLIGCYPDSFGPDTLGTTIALYITEVADVVVDVLDHRGSLVRTLTPPHEQRPGEVLIVWDGRDDRGEPVPVGEYVVKAIIRPTYSRPRYILRKELIGRVRRLPG